MRSLKNSILKQVQDRFLSPCLESSNVTLMLKRVQHDHTLVCHPELVSGSNSLFCFLKYKMLKQVLA